MKNGPLPYDSAVAVSGNEHIHDYECSAGLSWVVFSETVPCCLLPFHGNILLSALSIISYIVFVMSTHW